MTPEEWTAVRLSLLVATTATLASLPFGIAMSGGGPVLLRTNMGAGHGGASGRFNRLDEVAIAYAFALWVLGLAEKAEV